MKVACAFFDFLLVPLAFILDFFQADASSFIGGEVHSRRTPVYFTAGLRTSAEVVFFPIFKFEASSFSFSSSVSIQF
jgi:hypothetical protein